MFGNLKLIWFILVCNVFRVFLGKILYCINVWIVFVCLLFWWLIFFFEGISWILEIVDNGMLL